MDKQQLLTALQKELQYSGTDIKAEAQLLLAIKKGLNVDNFLINCDQVFKREFSKDLVAVEVKEDAKKNEMLELHLSRTGLYDQLPEGLFFQMPHRDSSFTETDMASDYRINKQKEDEIRRFFLPFDNDFFLQRLQVEEAEVQLLEGLRSGVLNDYFVRFWSLPPSIPKMFMVPLILLLPHAHKIAGELELMAQALSYLLKEEVRFLQKNADTSSAEGFLAPVLGEASLGLDMVAGDSFFEDEPVIDIEVGPIKNSQVRDYLEGGKRSVLMETFNRFFVPAGLDVIVSVKVPMERQDMMLEKGAEPVLGYSTVLG
jgi:hypothetical protein